MADAVESSGLVARTIAPYMPSPTSWVAVTLISEKPTARNPASYSAKERAPAMQPA